MAKDYKASDWERIPNDKARRYRNKKDKTKIISRRFYDQHYGRLAGTGLTNETLAQKNKADNPLLSALRPRKGKRAPVKNINRLIREIYKNARLAHGKKDIYIGSYEIAPEPMIMLQVFYALILAGKKQQSFYITSNMVNENGDYETGVFNPYERLPKTVSGLDNIFDDVADLAMRYGWDLVSITIHYRFKE